MKVSYKTTMIYNVVMVKNSRNVFGCPAEIYLGVKNLGRGDISK